MIVGLTGSIGSGKSTVAALLAQKGAVIVDTDVIAREVVEPPSPVLDAIRGAFGPEVLLPDGRLDRAALARLVFEDEARRARLNELTHPAILKRVLSIIGSQPPEVVVVAVVPLLFESGFERNCDCVVAVTAPPDVRRARLQERDGLTASQIAARMRAQLPDEEYRVRADIVIENDSTLTALGREVDRAWEAVLARRDRAQPSGPGPRPEAPTPSRSGTPPPAADR